MRVPGALTSVRRKPLRWSWGLVSYETVKKFIIAPTDFTPESGELTPTLKVKRPEVTRKYQQQLDRLYEEDEARRA
jgi:long-chain acyl-CoA synthetase